MPIFDGNLPYTNLHELNLDWIIKYLKETRTYVSSLQPAICGNVTDMVNSNLGDGSIAVTKGYYSDNDGGSATYIIRAKTPIDSEDGGRTIFLSSGLVAELIVVGNVYNVLQLGLKNDNSTDNNIILKKFLSNYNGTSLTLFFPDGTYKFNKSSTYLTLPDYTLLIGEAHSVLYFNDTEDGGVSLFNGATKFLSVKNLELASTFDTITSQTNSSLFYYNIADYYVDVLIENCKIKNFRRNVFETKNTNSLIIKNCQYYNIGRDCNRFLNCVKSVVSDCAFELCGDDVVSTHGNVANSSHIFCNNTVKYSFGPAYLGGKYVNIHDNTFVNPILLFKVGQTGGEGSDTEEIKFTNNIVIQPVRIYGVTDNKLMWLCKGTKNIYINSNKFKDDTLPTLDFINVVGVKYSTPSFKKGHFIISTNDSSYTHNFVQFNNNVCDLRTGATSGLDLGDTHFMLGKFKDLEMCNNVIENFYTALIVQANIKRCWVVRNNYFNGDKDHLLSTDGTFANSNVLRIFQNYPENFEDNIIRNISGNYGMQKRNKVLYQNDGKYMNPVDVSVDSLFVPYDESTGEIRNVIVNKASSMPTSGYYHSGTFVMRNYSSPTDPIGWYRATTGNSHTLGTDWIALYPKTN